MEKLEQRIHTRMQELKISQADIAKSLGASKSVVHGWVNGYTVPKSRYLVGLCDLLNVTPHWLLHGDSLEPLKTPAYIEVARLNSPGELMPFFTRGLPNHHLRDISNLRWLSGSDTAIDSPILNEDVLLIDVCADLSCGSGVFLVEFKSELNVVYLSEVEGRLVATQSSTPSIRAVHRESIVGKVIYRGGSL